MEAGRRLRVSSHLSGAGNLATAAGLGSAGHCTCSVPGGNGCCQVRDRAPPSGSERKGHRRASKSSWLSQVLASHSCLTVKSSGSNLPNSQIPGTVHCFCRPTFPQCWGRHPTELRGPVWGPAGSMRGRRVWASGEVVSGSFCALWGTHPLKAKASGPCSLASLARTSPHRRLLLVFLWPLFPKL